MRRISVLTTFVVAMLLLMLAVDALAAAGDPADESDARQAAIRAAIQNLLATVDVYAASEKPRLGKRADGTLEFFGAPPGAPARLDPELATATPEQQALAFLNQHAAAFGVDTNTMDFECMRATEHDGRLSLRLTQSYLGIPVYNGQLGIVMTDRGFLALQTDIMTQERYEGKGPILLQPVVGVAEAESAALETVKNAYLDDLESAGEVASADDLAEMDTEVVVLPETFLVIYDPAISSKIGAVSLAWEVTVGSSAYGLPTHRILINALSAETESIEPLVNNARCRKVGRPDEPPLRQEDLNQVPPIEAEPPTGDEGIDNCFDVLGDTYDFYYNHHGRDGFDNYGSCVDAGVTAEGDHCIFKGGFGGFYFCDNALACLWGLYFVFGWSVDDIVAHEYTHLVTWLTSGLDGTGEAGAINESFSDIWGEFIDQTNQRGDDSPEVKWQLAEDLDVEDKDGNPIAGPIRYMDDPTVLGHPDRINSPLYPANDIHHNAGVNNKLCYLLTDGDSFRGRSITGMDLDLVADLYYRVQTGDLLLPASTYSNLYYALGQAAIDLGLSATQRKNIEKACRAVEIRPTRSMAIKDAAGASIAKFTDGGDLILIGGDLSTNQTITASPTTSEFIIRNPSGTIFALLDTSSGDFKLKGKLYEEVVSPAPPAKSFIVKQATTVVSFITSSAWTDATLEPTYPHTVPAGSLILTGHVVSVDEE